MPTKFQEINWNPSTKERREFGRLLMIGFPFIALFWTTIIGLQEKGFHWDWELFAWIAGIGCGVGFLCMLLPACVRPLYCLWFFIVCIMDTLVSTLLLTAFFYCILTPFGLVIRLFGKHSLKKKRETCQSYWKDVPEVSEKSQYYRQF